MVQLPQLTETVSDTAWRKSSYSGPHGNCVELAVVPTGDVAVRNSRHPAGPALTFTAAELDAFLRGVKGGEFDDLLHPWGTTASPHAGDAGS
jgi:hypothetical protein